MFGEKIVIRILGRSDIVFSKNALGLSPTNEKMFDRIIASPHGIILVSGPTGSGKTTTLYTVLKDLNQITTNIITVEDPVEYRLPGVMQVQVNEKIDMSFSRALRSILRQDPDVVLVGEMRDAETAQIGLRAAMTGHLVLSTLHTNDAPSSVTRMLDMQVEDYLLTSTLDDGKSVKELLDEANAGLERMDAPSRVRWALEHLPPAQIRALLAQSLGQHAGADPRRECYAVAW